MVIQKLNEGATSEKRL